MTRDSKNQRYLQYKLEIELADILKSSEKEERKNLYSKVYDRYYKELQDEQKYQIAPIKRQREHLKNLKLKIVTPILPSNECTFLEVGSGFCDFTSAIALKVKKVISIEASNKLINENILPKNVSFRIIQSPPYQLDPSSIDVAFSCHFIEHLHPEDAVDHLNEVYRVLRPGGKYLCLTPNILYGPHDISQYFDNKVAAGLHLKEYSYSELGHLANKIGFKKIKAIHKLGTKPSSIAFSIYKLLERCLMLISSGKGNQIVSFLFKSYSKPFRPLEQIKIVFYK